MTLADDVPQVVRQARIGRILIVLLNAARADFRARKSSHEIGIDMTVNRWVGGILRAIVSAGFSVILFNALVWYVPTLLGVPYEFTLAAGLGLVLILSLQLSRGTITRLLIIGFFVGTALQIAYAFLAALLH